MVWWLLYDMKGWVFWCFWLVWGSVGLSELGGEVER